MKLIIDKIYYIVGKIYKKIFERKLVGLHNKKLSLIYQYILGEMIMI